MFHGQKLALFRGEVKTALLTGMVLAPTIIPHRPGFP